MQDGTATAVCFGTTNHVPDQLVGTARLPSAVMRQHALPTASMITLRPQVVGVVQLSGLWFVNKMCIRQYCIMAAEPEIDTGGKRKACLWNLSSTSYSNSNKIFMVHMHDRCNFHDILFQTICCFSRHLYLVEVLVVMCQTSTNRGRDVSDQY